MNLPEIQIRGRLHDYQRQLRFAEQRVKEMAEAVIQDALDHGATVSTLHDEIIIEYPDK